MRPLHPVHYDIGYFAGWKVVTIVLWLPIAGVLAAIFRPELQTSVLQVVVFAVVIWGAFMVRALMLWLLGMITLWTTRIAAICETYFMAELLLSGRLVPMALLPDWAQRISWFLPFRWAFAFAITALVGPIDRGDLVIGLAMQLLWIGFGAGVINVVWRRGHVRLRPHQTRRRATAGQRARSAHLADRRHRGRRHHRGVASTQMATDVGWSQALAFATMLVLAGIMIYCLWLIVSTGGFWLVRMDMVHELFNGLYRSAQYPISVYPTWLRAGLTFVVPLGIAVTAPAEAVTSRLSWATVAVCAAVAGSSIVVSRVIWRLGIRRYSGASA